MFVEFIGFHPNKLVNVDDDSKSCEKLKVSHNWMANLAGLR